MSVCRFVMGEISIHRASHKSSGRYGDKDIKKKKKRKNKKIKKNTHTSNLCLESSFSRRSFFSALIVALPGKRVEQSVHLHTAGGANEGRRRTGGGMKERKTERCRWKIRAAAISTPKHLTFVRKGQEKDSSSPYRTDIYSSLSVSGRLKLPFASHLKSSLYLHSKRAKQISVAF